MNLPLHIYCETWLENADGEWVAQCATPEIASQFATLAAENERLRGEVELHKDLLADEREELRHAVDTENRLTARVAALEAALQEYLDSHDFSLEASTMHKGAKCPCRDCQRARAALARPTPTPQGEQG